MDDAPPRRISNGHVIGLQERADEGFGLTFYLNESWTNQTFSTQFCIKVNSLAGLLNHIRVLKAPSQSAYLGLPLALPDCIFAVTVLKTLQLEHFTLVGLANVTDPLLRLPATLTELDLSECRLARFDQQPGTSYTPNWGSFFTSKPVLSILRLNALNLTGPIPSSVPNGLNAFTLSWNPLITGNLRPNHFRNRYIDWSGNSISGAIPSDLFGLVGNNENPKTYNFSHNALTGTIPEILLFRADLPFGDFIVDFSGNGLTGGLPVALINPNLFASSRGGLYFKDNLLSGTIPNFFNALTRNYTAFTIDLSGNDFSGTIPAFFSGWQFGRVATFDIDLSRNRLTGTLPASGFWPTKGPMNVSLNLGSNGLSGTIPVTFFNSPAIFESILLDVSNNDLNGTLEPNLISGVQHTANFKMSLFLAHNSLRGGLTSQFLAGAFTMTTFSIDISSNPIGPNLPDSLFSAYPLGSGTSLRTLSVTCANCSLRGSLPSVSALSLRSLYMNFDNNFLSSPFIDWGTYLEGALNDFPGDLGISAAHNEFTGILRFPDFAGSSTVNLLLNLYNNSMSSFVLGTNTYNYLKLLNLGMNLHLEGSLPRNLFDDSSILETFIANGTAMVGGFPLLSGAVNNALRTIDLSDTLVNFCGQIWTSPWTANLLHCGLDDTNAPECINRYPSLCKFRYANPGVQAPGALNPPANSPFVNLPPTPTSSGKALQLSIASLLIALAIISSSI